MAKAMWVFYFIEIFIVMGKMIITEQQLKILKDSITTSLINEGIWDNLKYSLSRLVQNKNQKISSRESQQIKDIINKAGNEIIKKMDDEITTKNPEFPNNPNTIDFLHTVMYIASIYDSILVAATKKSNVYGYLPVDAANGIINDLREYVKTIVDTDLRSVYSVVDNIEPENIVEFSPSGVRKHLQTKGLDFGRQNVLEPIHVPIVRGGSLLNLIKTKGAKQSRAKTLSDLYRSIRNINGGLGFFQQNTPITPPQTEPEPIVARGTEKPDNAVSTDDIYNSLRELFKFIVSNRKMLGIRSSSDVQNKSRGTYFHKMKNGDNVFYNGKPVKIVNSDTGTPNKTLVQYQNGTKMAVDSDKLHKLQESVIYEGKYLKNKQVLHDVSKAISTDKLNSFEEFMNRLEMVRNKIRNLKPTGDKVLDGWVKKIKTNPLIATNFQKIFNIDPDNKNVITTLISFINKLFATVYGGNFKNGQLMDKIASNKISENLDPTAFTRIAQDRSKFNQNVLTFLSDTIGFYQYLSKIKNNNTNT